MDVFKTSKRGWLPAGFLLILLCLYRFSSFVYFNSQLIADVRETWYWILA